MNNNIKAALLIVLGASMISSNDAILKISSESLGIGQMLFIRGTFATLIFVAIIKLTGRKIFSTSVVSKLNVIRAICECSATFCFVTSLSILSIATASTLVWTAPIFLTICSALFLGERVTLPRWLAVFAGFIGVLFVTNPFGSDFSWVMLLPLAAAFLVVIRDIVTRKLDVQVHSVHVVLTSLILVACVAGVVSIDDWRPVEFSQLAWLFLGSFLLSVGFFVQIEAIRMGELSFIAPFLFFGILVAVCWGYIIWNDVPSYLMSLGIVLIVLSGLYVLRNSGKGARKAMAMEPH